MIAGPEVSYPDPPIREAVVEFRFRDMPWKPTFPGILAVQPEIASLYDGEPRTQHFITAHLPLAPGEPAGHRVDEERTQLTTRAGDRVVTLGPRSLSVSTLRPYDGWDAFRGRIASAFAAHGALVEAERTLTRVGVRYINVLSLPEPIESLSDWFDCGPRAVEGLIEPRDPFMYRTTHTLSDGTRLTLSLTTLPAPGAFGLDFDLAHVPASPMPEGQAMQHAERLHGHARHVFESCITDKTREVLSRAG